MLFGNLNEKFNLLPTKLDLNLTSKVNSVSTVTASKGVLEYHRIRALLRFDNPARFSL